MALEIGPGAQQRSVTTAFDQLENFRVVELQLIAAVEWQEVVVDADRLQDGPFPFLIFVDGTSKTQIAIYSQTDAFAPTPK